MLRKILIIGVCISILVVPALAQDANPQRGGVVSGVCVSAITSLDPQQSELGICDASVYNLLFNKLVRMDEAGNVQPEVATDWAISEDGLTYTFTLRDDIVFHDGTPLDAEAVKLSIDRMRDEDSASPISGNLSAIDSVNVVDATTIEIVLSAPDTPFLSTLSSVVGATDIISPTALETYGDDFRFNAVGSGPFKLVSWSPGEPAIFERFEEYWEVGADGESLPYLDGVELNAIEDDTVRLLNLRGGEFDINERIALTDVASVEADNSLKIIETINATAYAVTMNLSQPPFDDIRVRQAVQLALDDDAIINNLGFGRGYVSAYPFPRGAWYFYDGQNPDPDLDRARELLAEAGYPDGLDVEFTHISRAVDAQLAQIVQAQLAQIGINADIQPLERTAWLDIWLVGAGENTEGELAIFQNTVGLGDPEAKSIFFEPGGIVNFSDWNNEEAWAAVEASRATLDQDERAALWAQAIDLQIEDVAYIWLGNVPVIGAADANLMNIELGGSNGSWIFTETYFEDGS